jgi:hypothetical protein
LAIRGRQGQGEDRHADGAWGIAGGQGSLQSTGEFEVVRIHVPGSIVGNTHGGSDGENILPQCLFFVGVRIVSRGHVWHRNWPQNRRVALFISRIISRNRSAPEKGTFDKRLSVFAQRFAGQRQKIAGGKGFLTIFCMARPPGVEPGLLG